jgi:hypothetical protein
MPLLTGTQVKSGLHEVAEREALFILNAQLDLGDALSG